MSQFCGQEAWCGALNSQRVANRRWIPTLPQVMMAAMRNVEEHYLVVGVTELWEETLEVGSFTFHLLLHVLAYCHHLSNCSGVGALSTQLFPWCVGSVQEGRQGKGQQQLYEGKG